MNRIVPLMVALLLSALGAKAQAADNVAVNYDGGEILDRELNLLTQATGSKYINTISTVMSPRMPPEERLELLGMLEMNTYGLVWAKQYAQKAREAGFELPPDIQKQVDEIVAPCYALEYEKEHLQDESKKKYDWEQILQEYRDEFYFPERRWVRYIFKYLPLEADMGELSAEKLELEKLRQQILDGEINLRQAAYLHSDAPSARDEGFLGIIRPDTEMDEDVKEWLFSLERNELSEIREFGNGLYLAQVESIAEPIEPDVAKIKERSGRQIKVARTIGRVNMERKFEELIEAEEADVSDEYVIARYARSKGFTDRECEALRDLVETYYLANHYFLDQHKDKFEVTDRELWNFANADPGRVLSGRLFKLRAYMVPIGDTRDAKIKNLFDALQLANQAYQDVSSGLPPEEVEQKYAERGLVVEEHDDWVGGSGVPQLDSQLLRMESGGVTTAAPGGPGAMFVELLERRRFGDIPIEELRERFGEQLLIDERTAALQKAQREYADSVNVQLTWLEKVEKGYLASIERAEGLDPEEVRFGQDSPAETED